MSRQMTGSKMVITVHITRGPSGLFLAKSENAPTFLASHTDEEALREAVPFMVKHWAEENGYGAVTVRILPSRAARRSASQDVRVAVEYARELVA